MMLDWKPRRSDVIMDPFGLGRIVQDGLVFRQNFSIRSYEIGADRSASIETVMNHLQVLIMIMIMIVVACCYWTKLICIAVMVMIGNGTKPC